MENNVRLGLKLDNYHYCHLMMALAQFGILKHNQMLRKEMILGEFITIRIKGGILSRFWISIYGPWFTLGCKCYIMIQGLVLRSRNEMQLKMNNSDGLDIDPVD